MDWVSIFDADHRPTIKEIRDHLRQSTTLWDELTSYIENSYGVKPRIDFSTCSMQPGWNVKYKKTGKALCTLYPMSDFFIALVVVGAKEEQEVSIGMEAGMFTSYVKKLYENSRSMAMGRWLMIEARDTSIIEDIKTLMRIRISPNT